MTRQTGHLTITQEEHRLEFFFADGEIAATSSTDIIGPDSPEKASAVLASSLNWESGSFIFEQRPLPEEIAAANLRLPTNALLLDVARQFDESQEAAANSAQTAETGGLSPSRTFTVADELRLQIVDHLLREDFRVPPMPQLAARVLELTRKEFSLRELGNLILTDQAVAAQILRYANSAMSGASRRVDTLQMAIQRLGTNEVVNIVLAVSLHAGRSGRDIFAEQKRQLWAHSNTTAFLAHFLAARVGLDPNLGFLCGLLIDFGMSVLYSLIQDVLHNSYAPLKIVAEIVQDYHARVGRVVGEKWQLPQAVIESITYHHCIEGATAERGYVCVSALADTLAALALSQPREDLEKVLAEYPPERLLSHPAARALGLISDKAEAIIRELPKRLDQALHFINS